MNVDDTATMHEEQALEHALAMRKHVPAHTGACLYCKEPVTPQRRFCESEEKGEKSDCHRAYELQERMTR